MTLRDEVIARFGDLIKEVPEAEAFIIEYETKRRHAAEAFARMRSTSMSRTACRTGFGLSIKYESESLTGIVEPPSIPQRRRTTSRIHPIKYAFPKSCSHRASRPDDIFRRGFDA